MKLMSCPFKRNLSWKRLRNAGACSEGVKWGQIIYEEGLWPTTKTFSLYDLVARCFNLFRIQSGKLANNPFLLSKAVTGLAWLQETRCLSLDADMYLIIDNLILVMQKQEQLVHARASHYYNYGSRELRGTWGMARKDMTWLIRKWDRNLKLLTQYKDRHTRYPIKRM